MGSFFSRLMNGTNKERIATLKAKGLDKVSDEDLQRYCDAVDDVVLAMDLVVLGIVTASMVTMGPAGPCLVGILCYNMLVKSLKHDIEKAAVENKQEDNQPWYKKMLTPVEE